MQTTRRRFIGLVGLSGLAALATACGDQQAAAPSKPGQASGSGQPSAAGQPVAAGQPAATAPAAATGGKTTVRFWYGLGGQLGEVIVGQINKFNAAQSAVEVQGVFQTNYNTVQEKFLASLVGGDVPELVQMEIHATPQFASSGALAPLEPFYANDPEFKFDDLVPATLLNQRWNGTLYAMPINRSTPLLYYNKSRFREAGLDPEAPPKTWNEFREVAQRLTRVEGGETKAYGFVSVADWWHFESMVWSNGGELLSQDLKTVTFAKPGAEVMQVWADLIYKQKAARALTGENVGDLRSQEFIQGRSAFVIDSTAGLGRFIRDVKDFELGTAFMPHTEGNTHAVPTGGAAAAIPAKVAPDKQRAAWEFVKWWISPEQGAFWSQNTGYFPVRHSSIDLLTQQGYYRERPQFKTTIDQLQYAREAPLTPHWPAIAKEITKGMEAIIVSNQPALEALTRAQERAQAIVEG